MRSTGGYEVVGWLARLVRAVNIGDPILKSNKTRRIDFALFMVEALMNDVLVHEAPAIVGCTSESALADAQPGADVVRAEVA